MSSLEVVEVDGTGRSASLAQAEPSILDHSPSIPDRFPTAFPTAFPTDFPIFVPERFPNPFPNPVPSHPTKKTYALVRVRQSNGFPPSLPVPILW